MSIFNTPGLDFKGNRAEGDDILGDAYKYLMRHFATESGKSKGQFYTPAEVSRILAKVIGIGGAPNPLRPNLRLCLVAAVILLLALIENLSENLLETFCAVPLIDVYDVYQHLLDYWAETMQDDVWQIAHEGWQAVLDPSTSSGQVAKPIADLIPAQQHLPLN